MKHPARRPSYTAQPNVSQAPERHIAVADAPHLASPAAPNLLTGQSRISLLHNDLGTINVSSEHSKGVGAKLALGAFARRSQWICPSRDPDTQLALVR
jgi:hypothetical protein